ncbi:MAG: DNA-protecting protein DprA [Deltaproteobacteria bacterium HGW-Deltaproteobacteria-1]|nr:MAG: DNA-protecting protein DprA [Deltaproteobacteria bacterium HGW-Deltaproteobacteria-1]
MIHDDLKYWMALKSIDGIGNASFGTLLKHFRSPSNVFSAAVADFSGIAGISKKSALAISAFKNWDEIRRQMDLLDKMGADIITWLDERYPANLLNIYDRPAFLFVLGHLPEDMIPVAIVGSRNATAYGRFTTDRLSRELALRGITIVSGMTISQNGAVISEYPPGTQPIPYHFPARNRIISGISYGVVVVEAGEKSGSLITASLAMEQGRDVFAIPGAIDSAHSRGTNSLIKQGAKLIDTIDDILEDVLPQLERSSVQPMQRQQMIFSEAFSEKDMRKNNEPFTTPVKEILKTLSQNIMHADDIIAVTGLPPAEVSSMLITLELKGIIEQHPGKYFSLKK